LHGAAPGQGTAWCRIKAQPHQTQYWLAQERRLAVSDKDDVRIAFEKALEDALRGGYVSGTVPLEWPVVDALDQIAAAYPNVTPDQIESARRKFDDQIGKK
jgi:hypothetical protein